MGLTVDLYKCVDRTDCSNGGITSQEIQGFCLTNVDGPFEPNVDYPAAKLVVGPFNSIHIKPEAIGDAHSMDGGTFAATSDSRLNDKIEELTGCRFYGAVAVHDRVENY